METYDVLLEVTPSVDYPFQVLSNITNEVTFGKDIEAMRS